MRFLSALFIAKPLNILAVAAAFCLGYLALRLRAPGGAFHPRSLLVAAAAWGLYAAWEKTFQVLSAIAAGEAIYNGSASGADTTVKLPKDGDYTIRVYLMGDAKSGKRSVPYTVSVTIT